MHPRLLWDDISVAAVAVLEGVCPQQPYRVRLEYQDVSGFDGGQVLIAVDPAGVSTDQVARLRRTYELSHVVELAAIAIAALGLYHGGGHEIRDVALRGSSADHLVDDWNHHLEIAGRSRRADFGVAWQQRWHRLTDRFGSGFYVCVAEFETPAARLAFAV
ncbi:MAG TPA: hypothetical protein VG013_33860 [Gemmataceae bacterium]|jgi:hypothetical protein|nr:hypothetical protein [Gemmataceae bacterium]